MVLKGGGGCLSDFLCILKDLAFHTPLSPFPSLLPSLSLSLIYSFNSLVFTAFQNALPSLSSYLLPFTLLFLLPLKSSHTAAAPLPRVFVLFYILSVFIIYTFSLTICKMCIVHSFTKLRLRPPCVGNCPAHGAI